MPTDSYWQEFSVNFRYPVHFCRGILKIDNPLLADSIGRLGDGRRQRVLVFIDTGVINAIPEIIERIQNYFAAHSQDLELVGVPEPVPGGEQAKNRRDAAERVMESIARHHLCRQSFVVAIGGGSALDIIGLATALVHRGLRLIRIPTTVLAQNDSGVGVKNGIDAYGVKNFAGVFAPPFAVLVDGDFLQTLPDKYWFGGLAEAFKVAIIKDADFFAYLQNHAAELRARCDATISAVIRRCAELHLEHIRTAGDPFEFGTARPLDFGHWAAHRLEVISAYAIGHGQAVAIGIALDTHTAWRCGCIDRTTCEAILKALQAVGLPVWSKLLERTAPDGRPELQRGLEDFREHLGGRLNITLPAGIGHRLEVNDMQWPLVAEGIAWLRDWEQTAHPNA